MSQSKCPPDKIYNPVSKRCVLKTGAIGKKLLSKKVSVQPVGKAPTKAEALKALKRRFERLTGKRSSTSSSSRSSVSRSPRSPKSSRSSRSPKSSKSKCAGVSCPAIQICNPASGRCVLRTGVIGKKLTRSPRKSPSATRKSPSATRKTREKKSLADCKAGQQKILVDGVEYCECVNPLSILNPITKNCVSRDGAIGRKILEGTLCPKGQVYNKIKGRCEVKGKGKSPSPHASISQCSRSPTASPTANPNRFVARLDRPCITKSKTCLTLEQARTVDYFQQVKSLLVVFETGMGKTLTALAAAMCFLEEHPTQKIIIITQKSLLSTFEKEFPKYGAVNPKKFQAYTYDEVMNLNKKRTPLRGKGALVIIDEVHTLRNPCSSKFNAVMKAVSGATKVMLLTATPFVNSVCDFVPIINLLHQEYVLAPTNARKKCPENGIGKGGIQLMAGCGKSIKQVMEGGGKALKKQLEVVQKLLKGKVSYAQKKVGVGSEYPGVEIHSEIIPMKADFQEAFNRAVDVDESTIFAQPEKFANGFRRAVNKLGGEYFSQKIDRAVELILSTPAQYSKNVVFSNWIEYGMRVLEKHLARAHVTYATITGDTPAIERAQIVRDFNNDPNLSTLIISNAGATGIDLKGVQKVIVLDPVWNNASLEQIKGRGVRYRSHVHLPPEFRTVHIYLLQLVEREFAAGTTKTTNSGDALLYKIIERKSKAEEIISKMLKSLSI